MSDESKITIMKNKTGFDEDTIGCYLSNYNDRNVCGRFCNTGCSSLVKCQTLKKIEEMAGGSS